MCVLRKIETDTGKNILANIFPLYFLAILPRTTFSHVIVVKEGQGRYLIMF